VKKKYTFNTPTFGDGVEHRTIVDWAKEAVGCGWGAASLSAPKESIIRRIK
jgi:hypothetical protein